MEVARGLGTPHLDCTVHKMNLAVSKFLENKPNYSKLIDELLAFSPSILRVSFLLVFTCFEYPRFLFYEVNLPS